MSTMMPRSVLRHRPIATDIQEWIITPPQTPSRQTAQLPALAKRSHPVVLIGLSMLATLLLLWTLGNLWNWSILQLDTLRYGSPRTTQIDYMVGHGNQPSHFTAWNLSGQIYVLEIPSNNPATSHLLVGPHLIGADLAPVQLHFVGDIHHPDLLIEVQGMLIRYHNTGNSYILTTS